MSVSTIKRSFEADVPMMPNCPQFQHAGTKRLCQRSLEEQQRMAQAYHGNSSTNPYSPFTSQGYSTEQAVETAVKCKKVRNGCHPSQVQQQLFTLEEVAQIVKKSVEERENVLRQEYDITLQQKLQEQFDNFAKFNQDYISRQLKQSDFSYMS